MKLDFTTPNVKTIGWIDSYMQFHDNKQVQKATERIADSCYNNSYDGWEKQPQKVIESAFYKYKSAMIDFNITEDDINNQ